MTVSLSPEPSPFRITTGSLSSSLTTYEGITLTDGGDSSSSESDFDDETAQGLFNDKIVKMLSVALLHSYKGSPTKKCQGMGVLDAAQESALFIGLNS